MFNRYDVDVDGAHIELLKDDVAEEMNSTFKWVTSLKSDLIRNLTRDRSKHQDTPRAGNRSNEAERARTSSSCRDNVRKRCSCGARRDTDYEKRTR